MQLRDDGIYTLFYLDHRSFGFASVSTLLEAQMKDIYRFLERTDNIHDHILTKN